MGLAKSHEGERYLLRSPDYPQTINAKGCHTSLVSAIHQTKDYFKCASHTKEPRNG